MNNMITFAECCSGHYFVIPENQRGFSWSTRQVSDLVADLNLAGNQSHYMGPLIVSRTPLPDFQDDRLKTTAEFDLEDGQQRLTTLFIFANEIRKRMVANNIHALDAAELENFVFLKHGGMKLRLQNKQLPLQEYLSYILTGAPAPPAQRIPAMNALDEVQKSIAEHVDPLNDRDLLFWKQKICNQALFVWVDLKTAGVNKYLTFDAINSRGLPLSEFDKIKNFCILVVSARAILGVDVASNWFKALVQLQAFGADSRTNEADFIAELYSSYHNKPVSHRDVHATFVNKYRSLLTASDAKLEADLLHFVSLWETYAKSFGFLSSRKRQTHYGSICDAKAGIWLDRLDNMGLPTITRPLLAASHLSLSKTEFTSIARACEIYTFRVHAVIGKRKDANATKVIDLANEILRGGKDAAHVLRRICSWLNTLAPMSGVIGELADGKAKYAYDPLVKGWQYCYYFLYEYELSVSPLGVEPIPWGINKEEVKNQQEHILPQQHRDGGWWEKEWPDASKADKHKHRLGNLVLTSNNPALARRPISEKVTAPPPAHCYTHANATNSEKMIPTFTDGKSWQATEILKREFALLKFASSRWNLGCIDDNGSISLPTEFSAVGSGTLLIESSDSVDSEENEPAEDALDNSEDENGVDDNSI